MPVALSTASVWPEPAGVGFQLAAELGFDGVEVMVWNDPVSQDVPALAALSHRFGVPILAVHAPCLLVTQRVWAADPAQRLQRSVQAATTLGVRTVVVHPPLRWHWSYAAGFADQVAELECSTGVAVAVENMFPLRRGRLLGIGVRALAGPHRGRPRALHAGSVAHRRRPRRAVALAERMGEQLVHLHLADGTGAPRDEHLVPGHGTQPCAQVCRRLVERGFTGTVAVEINTRRARDRAQRQAALAESLRYARRHLFPNTF